MCSKAKLDPTKLWRKRLGHINYKDFVHLVNTKRLKGIPRLSGIIFSKIKIYLRT